MGLWCGKIACVVAHRQEALLNDTGLGKCRMFTTDDSIHHTDTYWLRAQAAHGRDDGLRLGVTRCALRGVDVIAVELICQFRQQLAQRRAGVPLRAHPKTHHGEPEPGKLLALQDRDVGVTELA